MAGTPENYKGLNLLSGTSGAGGTRLMNAFRALADRVPTTKYDATTDPTVNDDTDAGYYVGSKWYNLNAGTIWECLDATVGAAVWVTGTTGEGNSGFSGYSGRSGYSGGIGLSGFSGRSGTSGYSGWSGFSGYSGVSGYSGKSGYSGVSGYSGYSGPSGFSGFSGFSGSGFSGYSGSGVSGYSGYSGYSGKSGTSGTSGYSGASAQMSGYSGYSGYSGKSGVSGFSGYSGASPLSTYYNIRDYGALGDYTTDDTRAIQAAFDAASINIPGFNTLLAGVSNYSYDTDVNAGTVYIPHGRYRVSAPIKVQGGVSIIGDNPPGCLIDGVFANRSCSITQSGGTATATVTGNHGYQTGDKVTISGATPSNYNGDVTVTAINDTQFTYSVAGNPSSPAGGSPQVQIYRASHRAVFEGQLNAFSGWSSCHMENLFIRNDVGFGVRVDQSDPFKYLYTTVISYDGSSYTNRDTENSSWTTGEFELFGDTSHYLYMGHSSKTTGVTFHLGREANKVVTFDYSVRRNAFKFEYWNGSTWANLPTTYDLSVGLDVLYNTAMGWNAPSDWATTTVNGSNAYYFVRMSINTGAGGAACEQTPIFRNISHTQAGVNIHAKELHLKTRQWGVFFPDCYSQTVTLQQILLIAGGAGAIWIHGNANIIDRCESEAGAQNAETDFGVEDNPYGMLTVWGGGNTIRDNVMEGGYVNLNTGWSPYAYHFRGDTALITNNWLEGSYQHRDGFNVKLEQCHRARIVGTTNTFHIYNSNDVSIAGGAVSFVGNVRDNNALTGYTTVTYDGMNAYWDAGDDQNPRVLVRNTYSSRGDSLITPAINPISGNLLVNGDFKNGSLGWRTYALGNISATTTIEQKPDGSGNQMKTIFDGGTYYNQQCGFQAVVDVPSVYVGSEGWAGYRIELVGNMAYLPLIGTGASRGTFGKSVVRIDEIDSTQMSFDLRCVMGTYQLPYLWINDNDTWTDKNSAIQAPFPMFATATSYTYISFPSAATSIAMNFETFGSGCTTGVQYWNGSTWTNVGSLSDGTSNYTQNGTVTFTASGWASNSVNSISGYWLRFKTTGMTTSPKLGFITSSPSPAAYMTYDDSNYFTRTPRASASSSTKFDILADTSKEYYFGATDFPINEMEIKLDTNGSGITYTIEYWDGGEWTEATIDSDGTNSFTQSGTIAISFPTPIIATYVNKVWGRWWKFKASAVSGVPKLAYVTLPLKGTAYLSDAYFVAGTRHNNPPTDVGQCVRFGNGNVQMYANNVYKYNGSNWVTYVTTSQAPNVGTWKAGDQVLFNAPTAAGYMGWVCITGGTDGSTAWKRFGAIEP